MFGQKLPLKKNHHWNMKTTSAIFHLLFFTSILSVVSSRSGPVYQFAKNLDAQSISEIFRDINSLDLTSDCSRVLQSVKLNDETLVMMVDAWGKPGAGILQGNFNWIGRASECRQTKISNINFTNAQTFEQTLVILQVSPVEMDSPEIVFGVCLPEACEPDDVIHVMESLIQRLDDGSVYVEISDVVPAANGDFDWRYYFSVLTFAFLATCVLVATLFDACIVCNNSQYEELEECDVEAYVENESTDIKIENEAETYQFNFQEQQKVFLCFSLYRTLPKMMNLKDGEGQIDCLNGIRVLSISWVVLFHTVFLQYHIYPMKNYSSNYEYFQSHYASRFLFQICGNGTFAVDSFFVLSGFLMTYWTLKKLQSIEGKINAIKFWASFYARRYLRLTPALMFVMLASVGFWKVSGNNTSPLWQPMETEVSACEQKWWMKLLYISNLIGYDSCMAWTWYLAVDFQLYAISPPVLFLMYKYPVVGGAVTILMTAVSCITSFIVSYDGNFPPGGSADLLSPEAANVYDTYNYIEAFYSKPWIRFKSYGVGMLLGLFIYTKPPRSFRVPCCVPFIGWILAFLLMFCPLFGLWKVPRGHFPTRLATAFYNAMSRVSFSLGMAWMIWACMFGYGFLINRFLSLKLWVPLARMSYMVFLIHSFVIRLTYSTSETMVSFTPITIGSLYVTNIVFSFFAAFFLVLLVELPIMGIQKIYIG